MFLLELFPVIWHPAATSKAMGISPKAQKLPPQAVKFICEDYCIDLPPELQDQKALSKSPIRDLILQSWEDEQLYLQARENLKSHIATLPPTDQHSA